MSLSKLVLRPTTGGPLCLYHPGALTPRLKDDMISFDARDPTGIWPTLGRSSSTDYEWRLSVLHGSGKTIDRIGETAVGSIGGGESAKTT